MNDLDIHKLTGAYATDALDDLERARFEQHVADCDDCRAEVAELREAAARMAAITETTPPASLRSSVLAGIAEVRPLPPVVPVSDEESQDDSEQPGRVDSQTPHTDDSDAPTPITRGKDRRSRKRWVPALVAAALALVAGLSAWQPWAPSPEEMVLEAADAERVLVDLDGAARAEVVRSKAEDRAVIITEDMPPAPKGSVYQLWFQDPQDGSMIPAGLMPEGEDNVVMLDGSASDATAVGITVEPEGGSDEPSGEPIVVFDLTQAR